MTVEEQMIIEHRNGVYVGRIEEKWSIARKMKENGIDAALITQCTDLTVEEVESIDLSQPEA